MANGSWSGLPGITVEDAVIQLSQGAILDRSKENLVPADAAIVRARRLLLESVQRVSRGQDPIGLAPKNSHANPIGRKADCAGRILACAGSGSSDWDCTAAADGARQVTEVLATRRRWHAHHHSARGAEVCSLGERGLGSSSFNRGDGKGYGHAKEKA